MNFLKKREADNPADDRTRPMRGPTSMRGALYRLLGKHTVRAASAHTISGACAHGGSPGILCESGHFKGLFFPFSGDKIVMGRNEENCNIVFPHSTRGVSATHCELIWDVNSQKLVLRDLGSTYGTLLFDGTCLRSQRMAVLRAGESFCIGENNRFTVIYTKEAAK